MPKFTYTSYDDEGNDFEVELPGKYEVCYACHGEGTETLRDYDFSARDFQEDPDFAEAYFGGRYDKPCRDCKGSRVVVVIDRGGCKPEQIEAYDQRMKDLHDYYMECAAEY